MKATVASIRSSIPHIALALACVTIVTSCSYTVPMTAAEYENPNWGPGDKYQIILNNGDSYVVYHYTYIAGYLYVTNIESSRTKYDVDGRPDPTPIFKIDATQIAEMNRIENDRATSSILLGGLLAAGTVALVAIGGFSISFGSE